MIRYSQIYESSPDQYYTRSEIINIINALPLNQIYTLLMNLQRQYNDKTGRTFEYTSGPLDRKLNEAYFQCLADIFDKLMIEQMKHTTKRKMWELHIYRDTVQFGTLYGLDGLVEVPNLIDENSDIIVGNFMHRAYQTSVNIGGLYDKLKLERDYEKLENLKLSLKAVANNIFENFNEQKNPKKFSKKKSDLKLQLENSDEKFSNLSIKSKITRDLALDHMDKLLQIIMDQVNTKFNNVLLNRGWEFHYDMFREINNVWRAYSDSLFDVKEELIYKLQQSVGGGNKGFLPNVNDNSGDDEIWYMKRNVKVGDCIVNGLLHKPFVWHHASKPTIFDLYSYYDLPLGDETKNLMSAIKELTSEFVDKINAELQKLGSFSKKKSDLKLQLESSSRLEDYSEVSKWSSEFDDNNEMLDFLYNVRNRDLEYNPFLQSRIFIRHVVKQMATEADDITKLLSLEEEINELEFDIYQCLKKSARSV